MRRIVLLSTTALALSILIFFDGRVYCKTLQTDTIQHLATIDDCINASRRAGNLIQQGKTEEALNLLYDNHFIRPSDASKEKAAFLSGFRARTAAIEFSLGSRFEDGFEYVGTLKLADSFLTVYFISKYEYSGIIWKFDFYRPHKEWKFTGAGIDPEFTGEVLFLTQPVRNPAAPK